MPSFPTEPDGFPYHLWYRLARRRLSVAGEVTASSPDRRAWVWVTPYEDGRYGLWRYEILAERFEEIRSSWDYDEPGMLLDQEQFWATDDDQLLDIMLSWVGDLSLLKDPGLSGAPV